MRGGGFAARLIAPLARLRLTRRRPPVHIAYVCVRARLCTHLMRFPMQQNDHCVPRRMPRYVRLHFCVLVGNRPQRRAGALAAQPPPPPPLRRSPAPRARRTIARTGSGKTELCKQFENTGFNILDEAFFEMPKYSLHPQSLTMETMVHYALPSSQRGAHTAAGCGTPHAAARACAVR